LSQDTDARRVPAAPGRGEVREKASRFFGAAARADSVQTAARFVEGLRREHHDATHVAFAWKIGAGPLASRRASDDGEPAGTAGKPIAGAIESSGLTDVVAAVVRYFGGTKLGKGGLSRAYRLAAERALAACGEETIYETLRIEARCGHDRAGAVRRLIRPPDVRLLSERFTPEPVLELEVRRSLAEALEAALTEARIEHARLG
jgi:uncharacterized YigZ family protein